MENKLGYITWTFMSVDDKVNLEKLKEWAKELDVDLKFPAAPTPVNIFKRACKSVKVKDEHWDGGEVVYSCKKHSETKEIVRYDIFSNISTHLYGGQICWDKTKNEITYQIESGGAKNLVEAVKADMDINEGKIDHMAIRGIIRSYVEDVLKGVWIKSGTYFVAPEHENKLYNLSVVFRNVGIHLDVLPLIRETGTEEILMRSYNNQCDNFINEAKEIIDEIYKSDKQPNAIKLKKIDELISEIQEKETEYYKLKCSYLLAAPSKYLIEEKEKLTSYLKDKYKG